MVEPWETLMLKPDRRDFLKLSGMAGVASISRRQAVAATGERKGMSPSVGVHLRKVVLCATYIAFAPSGSQIADDKRGDVVGTGLPTPQWA
jgi:hypothetical protein